MALVISGGLLYCRYKAQEASKVLYTPFGDDEDDDVNVFDDHDVKTSSYIRFEDLS